jgi:hypothetical protein
MKNYRIQNACVNCKHVFVWNEYDDERQFYCTLNAPPRPRCGSVLFEEEFSGSGKYDSEASDAWLKWSENRRVEAQGICEGYEKFSQPQADV